MSATVPHVLRALRTGAADRAGGLGTFDAGHVACQKRLGRSGVDRSVEAVVVLDAHFATLGGDGVGMLPARGEADEPPVNEDDLLVHWSPISGDEGEGEDIDHGVGDVGADLAERDRSGGDVGNLPHRAVEARTVQQFPCRVMHPVPGGAGVVHVVGPHLMCDNGGGGRSDSSGEAEG